ncbi:MAG: alpha/beta fold hydrolase, partial [Planctomycetaceae bacterium]
VTLMLRVGEGAEQEWQFEQLPGKFAVDLTGLPAGDHEVRGEVRVGEVRVRLPTQRMSLIADAEARLKVFEERLGREGGERGEPTAAGGATVVATLKESQRLVRRLLEKDDAETDLPGDRLLREAEELAVDANRPGGATLWQRPGEYWVTLSNGKRTQRARLLVPAGEPPAGGARPLVVALHGAGGSENMFFDAYGAGKIVRLCEARGWLLVTPGSSPLGGGLELPEVVAALKAHYGVDAGRVAVVGHSMGAMQGLQLAGRNPQALKSLAILGGGRPVRSPAGLREVDLFAAAGAEDFGRGGVRQVIAQWRGAGLQVEERDYPQVEHLGVVQVALDEVFAQFEKSFARNEGAKPQPDSAGDRPR